MPLLYDGIDHPVEITPDGGDLRYSSTGIYVAGGAVATRAITMAGGRQISFAQIFGSQPMIAAFVGWLMRQAIRVPLKAYRRASDDSRERLEDGHPLAAGIAAPWERAGTYDLVRAMLGPELVHGNALVEVDEGAGGAIRFRPADWRFAWPLMPFRDSVAGWELDADWPELTRTRPVDTVLHVAWWSPLGPLGISPLAQLGVTLTIEDAAQRHQTAMLNNGARTPSAITATEQFLGLDPAVRDALLAQLRADITALYAGPENSGRPALLPPGLDWKPVGQTAQEAALIEQRMITRDEAGAVFSIPPGVLGLHLERGNTLGEQRQMAYVDGLAPPLLIIEHVLNSQLARGLMQLPDVYVEFDFAGILRGDRLKEIEALREAIGTALLTPNEGRRVLNMPQSDKDGMDDFYLPRNNLWPVDVAHPDVPNAAAVGTAENLPTE